MLLDFRNTKFDITIDAPPSKSIYHRELIIRYICGDRSLLTENGNDNEDIRATRAVLRGINDCITSSDVPDVVTFPCNESGSTLRFMIPVAAAFLLGTGNSQGTSSQPPKLVFETKGRLFDRPVKELADAMAPHGITIEKDESTRNIVVTGKMTPGEYVIDGSVSSQYISGLLMALTLFDEKCRVTVTGEMKSVHYIELTQDVLNKYGCPAEREGNVYYTTPCNQGSLDKDMLPEFHVEGDWSNGAFLLCLREWSDLKVTNLNPDSKQGDRAILDFINVMHDADNNSAITWDCSDIPDITPYMAVAAAFTFDKSVFTGISRLRIKESDRVMAVRSQLSTIGIRTEETDDSLTVYGNTQKNNRKDDSGHENPDNPVVLSSFHDHRMAMCAVLIGVILKCRVDIDDMDCMRKSFPEFLEFLKPYIA